MVSEKNQRANGNFQGGESSQQALSARNTYEEFPPIESYLPKSKFDKFFLIFKKYIVYIAIATFLLLTAVVSFSVVYKIRSDKDSIEELTTSTTVFEDTTTTLNLISSTPEETTTILDDDTPTLSDQTTSTQPLTTTVSVTTSTQETLTTKSLEDVTTVSNTLVEDTTIISENFANTPEETTSISEEFSSVTSTITFSEEFTTVSEITTESTSTSTIQTTTQDPYNYISAILNQTECIRRDKDIIVSQNGCFHLMIRNDGNMVIYRVRDNRVTWTTNTVGSDGQRTCMQSDGNFLMYDSRNNPVWQLPLSWRLLHVLNIFNQPEYAILENDGALYLKKYIGTIKWSSESISPC